MQKILKSNMGKASITFSKINRWVVMNLFKAYLIGMFSAPADKRFTHQQHSKYGLNLYYGSNKIPLFIKERSLDVTRPFVNLNKTDVKITYELYLWNNLYGFQKLQSTDRVPVSVLAEGLDPRPEYIVCLNYGENKNKKWCNISCSPWVEPNKVVAIDWHDHLAKLIQKQHYA